MVKKFFKACGKILKIEDIVPILRRIDRDDDGIINYEEFIEAIKPKIDVIISDNNLLSQRNNIMKAPSNGIKSDRIFDNIIDKKSSIRFKSSSKSSVKSNNQLFRDVISPKNGFLSSDRNLKVTSTSSKTFKDSSPRVTKHAKSHSKWPRFSETVPIGKIIEKTSRASSSLRNTSRASSSLRNKNLKIKAEIIKVFREIISLEREIELAKQNLALRTDYNVFDTFRLFDKKGKGMISIAEIQQAFNELKIFPNKAELYLFIKRLDKDSDGKLM